MMLCVFTLSVLSINAWALQQLSINSGVNVVYNAPMFEALTIFQPINQEDPSWTKIGYNATLSANAVKIESNSLSDLASMLTDEDQDGNLDGVTYTEDDYYTAPVYRKIDNVNVDINTGEIIGKLSDPNYPFEWYGREVPLPEGYTLASGRTLTEEETFTVDVYTYYPEMYVLRYVQDNVQYISIAETSEAFEGENISIPEGVTPVHVKEWYTATFEATIFNPDRRVAQNEYGIIPRSYIYDYSPITRNSAQYFQDYYYFEKLDGTANSSSTYDENLTISDLSNSLTTQQQYLDWSNNLTLAWQNSNLSSEYKTASGVQGENYTAFIYNLLYLVKYANNDSQEMVGYGNTFTYTIYYNTQSTVTSESGAVISTAGSEQNSRFEAQKGGGTIGVYNPNEKNTAEYTLVNGVYRLSEEGFDTAGMNYGYNSSFVYTDSNNVTHKSGLYTIQFLTQNIVTTDGERKVLRDGYAGSDSHTSVFCLGSCNPWGNVWTWVFGTAAITDGTDYWAYVNFNDYEHGAIDTWVTDLQGEYETENTRLTEQHNYIKLSYTIPNLIAVKRYLGTSDRLSSSGLETLVGLPAGESDATTNLYGLCDDYQQREVLNLTSVIRGASTSYYRNAGAFCLYISSAPTHSASDISFRTMFILD